MKFRSARHRNAVMAKLRAADRYFARHPTAVKHLVAVERALGYSALGSGVVLAGPVPPLGAAFVGAGAATVATARATERAERRARKKYVRKR